VLIGESADDLFGTFKFVLRLYRGPQLRRYLQRQLERGLPDDLAHLQNIFRPWGISVVDPYWTRAFVQLRYNLPLEFRLDRHRQMKAILRDAFASMLPPEINLRTSEAGPPRHHISPHLFDTRARSICWKRESMSM
jgi:asparagine synthetase B (glutamine-hydrolysing)